MSQKRFMGIWLEHALQGLVQGCRKRAPIVLAGAVGLLALLPALRLTQNVSWRDHSPFLSSQRTFSHFASLERHRPVGELYKGKFLVASHQIRDPRFMETVLLLIQRDQYGTVGLIINRPTEIKLSDILPNIREKDGEKHFTYIGGPVAINQVQLLIHFPGKLEESEWVFDDVYVSSSRSVLERLIKNPDGKTKFRAYAGSAGWLPGQLEQEVARGDWQVMQADSDTIFDKAPSEIWPDLIRATELIPITYRDGIHPTPLRKRCMGGI